MYGVAVWLKEYILDLRLLPLIPWGAAGLPSRNGMVRGEAGLSSAVVVGVDGLAVVVVVVVVRI